MAVYLAYQISVMIRLHPYEYIYYNQLVGVLPMLSGVRTDYWGTSASQAAKWLVHSLEKNGISTGGKVKVFVTGATEYLPSTISRIGLNLQAINMKQII